jgi:hypothetical protein
MKRDSEDHNHQAIYGSNLSWSRTWVRRTRIGNRDYLPSHRFGGRENRFWKYADVVNGNFDAFGGFNIFFDPSLYSNVENPPFPVNVDWSVSTIELNAGLPAHGLYSATALVNNPSLAHSFTLTFI